MLIMIYDIMDCKPWLLEYDRQPVIELAWERSATRSEYYRAKSAGEYIGCNKPICRRILVAVNIGELGEFYFGGVDDYWLNVN